MRIWRTLSPKTTLALLLSSFLLSSCVHRTLLTDVHGSLLGAAHGKLKQLQEKLPDASSLPLPTSTEVWFVRPGNGKMELVAVKRRIDGDNKIESAVRELLDGPSSEELGSGIGSEIPRGTVLLAVSEKDGKIEVDLSKRFAMGGGIDSIETRLVQLSRTVAPLAPSSDVFLNVEGRRLTMTPGEGIEVKQPINK